MKRTKMIPLVLALVSILGFYGIASGAGDPTICYPLPPPNSGPYITGFFTATLDQEFFDHYNVHFVLIHKAKVHLFSYTYFLLGAEPSLCELTPVMIKDPEGFMAQVPCRLDVGGPFGLSGTPVIKDVFILKKESCDDLANQMIYGAMVIRVVP